MHHFVFLSFRWQWCEQPIRLYFSQASQALLWHHAEMSLDAATERALDVRCPVVLALGHPTELISADVIAVR